MKPSANALIGYTYQQYITFLFLVKMDAEREISRIEIEADVNHNFDDIKIHKEDEVIYSQIKDFKDVSFSDLEFVEDDINIKGKLHTLSEGVNILIFKKIDIETNSEIFGLPALKISNTYILSLSRDQANEAIDAHYSLNEKRESKMNKFFLNCLDKRKFKIHREDLPIVEVYDTKLIEKTIDVGKEHLKFNNILLIEGKPGIGKSHYVNHLTKMYDKNIVYRFWISNQDNEYKSRLIYQNFINDLSKKLFSDYKKRDESSIINKINKSGLITIIDGLDHVENYNHEDLVKYVDFIDLLGVNNKVIVLSRPLKFVLSWKKQVLNNWNKKETNKVLDELHHIQDYEVRYDIYQITDGYPILVRFISGHYKIYNKLPQLDKLKDLDDYYSKVITNLNTSSALSIFLVSTSFYMKSELAILLEGELHDCVKEIISTCPYLFEIRLNRVSLFHDSFNKYLNTLGLNVSKRREHVNSIVYQSIIDQEVRFLSRISHFQFDYTMKLNVIRKYTSISLFSATLENCIDFEAMRSFYFQLRTMLADISHNDLDIINYYDLSLIINIVSREHVSSINQFLYTYIKCLLYNGYSEEDVTSSQYLFGMLCYVKENDASILYNVTSDDHYDTSHFLYELEITKKSEERYFIQQEKAFNLKKDIEFFLNDEYNRRDDLEAILVNLYLHHNEDRTLVKLHECVKTYIDNNEYDGISLLEEILQPYSWSSHSASWLLNDVKKKLFSLGKLESSKAYINNSLKQYISAYSHKGSFDMWVNVLNYLRLSLHHSRKIDLSGIGLFFTMYGYRKDYSVVNIGEAFKVFEENDLISEEQSIHKIVFIQSMSEKGVRHLLCEYLSLHNPEIIKILFENYHLDNLLLSCFDLPSSHIDVLPENVFNQSLNQLMRYHSSNKRIDFSEIENVYHSSKWQNLYDKLKFFRFGLNAKEDSIELNNLDKVGLSINIIKEDNKYKHNSQDRYNKGILGEKDKAFIVDNKLSVQEVSGYLNGNYSALAEIEVYDIFKLEDISNNIKEILYNATLGKINSINSFGNPYHFVGNLPRLVNDNCANPSIEELYNSFKIFLKLSQLESRL